MLAAGNKPYFQLCKAFHESEVTVINVNCTLNLPNMLTWFGVYQGGKVRLSRLFFIPLAEYYDDNTGAATKGKLFIASSTIQNEEQYEKGICFFTLHESRSSSLVTT